MYKKNEYLLLLLYLYYFPTTTTVMVKTIHVKKGSGTGTGTGSGSGSGRVIHVNRLTTKGWPYGFWLYKSEEARKKAGPKNPMSRMPSLRQQKVQTMLQLLYANKALNVMRIRGITSGAAWDEATNLKKTALFARKAWATPLPS